MARKAPLPTLARSVADIISGKDELARRIRDRSSPITRDLVEEVLSLLQIGYPGRRPRTLVDSQGRARPTDMDLASFLIHLTDKPTTIELPAYETALPRTVQFGEHHLGDRRFGNLVSLSSHTEHLSFGVTIEDMSVMRRNEAEEDVLGTPRTFLIISHAGEWHSGWHGVSWEYRADEVSFRTRYDLVKDETHQGYQYFVHPNRRHSIFSRAHFLLKLLWHRLDENIAHLEKFGEAKTATPAPTRMKREKGRHLLVPTFTMKLTGLPLTGEYQAIEDDTGETIRSQLWFLSFMRTKVQFLVRVNEYAFYRYGLKQDYVAHWIKNGAWHHFKTNDQHRHLASLTLAPGVALGYKCDLVSKLVAAR